MKLLIIFVCMLFVCVSIVVFVGLYFILQECNVYLFVYMGYDVMCVDFVCELIEFEQVGYDFVYVSLYYLDDFDGVKYWFVVEYCVDCMYVLIVDVGMLY